jgi:hypothetical protein
MTDKNPPSAETSGEPAAAPAKAKIVLPKPAPRHADQGRGKGQGASIQRFDSGHSQTANKKPPRLPGRNG